MTYVHRGAPGDVRVVSGAAIVELGRSFFHLRPRGGRSASIPYHRVLRIERGGAPIWERRVPAPPAPPAPAIEREFEAEPDDHAAP